MGMELIGKNPVSDNGAYFGRSIWRWTPLAEFINDICPSIASRCEEWFMNSGDGLDGEDAAALADQLDAAVVDGTAVRYINALRHEPPDERWNAGRAIGADFCERLPSWGLPPMKTKFDLEVEDIIQFAAFSRASGGFEIW
jgi:hypothetical protein